MCSNSKPYSGAIGHSNQQSIYASKRIIDFVKRSINLRPLSLHGQTIYSQYFTKGFRSSDFSRFLAERLKSLLRFRDLLILFGAVRMSATPSALLLLAYLELIDMVLVAFALFYPSTSVGFTNFRSGNCCI